MAEDLQPDEDDSVLMAVEGVPGLEAKPDPESFSDDKEQDDPEEAS
jgi:hypothetical protein